MNSWIVSQGQHGLRVDQFLAEVIGLSRSSMMRLIDEGHVRVGHRRAKKGDRLEIGQTVTCLVDAKNAVSSPPVDQPELPLEVLYEDSDLVVVNKLAGYASHPLQAGERGTLASALVARYPECATASEDAREGGLCHRLDTHTSGVIVAARHRAAWLEIRQTMSSGTAHKEYLALCAGSAYVPQGEIDVPLFPQSEKKMAVGSHPPFGQKILPALTRFEVVQQKSRVALIRATIDVGRRHQVRAHLAYIGLPLYGDALYGGPALAEAQKQLFAVDEQLQMQGQLLHSHKISLPRQSKTQKPVLEIEAPLSPVREKLFALLLSAD